MGKKFKKLLAAALCLIMLFTFCTVPMIVSAEPPADETYDEYDEVTYDDLKLDGNSLDTQHTLSGGITFTYDVTSPSYSAVLKYRFIAGSKPGVQFSFDEGASGNISYPFGAWIKRPNSDGAGENGAWHLKPDTLSMVNMSTPLVEGTAYDIELGRLKVLTGENAGKYYVYLKVDDELIQEGYSAVDENGYYTSGSKTDCQLSNKIRFGCWGNGAEDKMTASPVPETYDEYDEVTYDDLKLDGNSLDTQHTLSGGITFTYDVTSPSYSAVLKYRFIAGSKPGVQFSFDEGASGNISYPFGAWIKRPNSDGAGENGAWHLKPDTLSMVNMSTPLVEGTAYDIELGRLKVLTGENAGKYYVYLKVDDELIQEGYSAVDENGYYTSGSKTDCQLSNKIRFGCWGNGAEDKMTQTPVTETYETATEIGFTDLKDGDSYLSGEKSMGVGSKQFTFDAGTYSNVVKFTWKAGVTATNEFKVSFDEVGDQISDPFGFGVKASNGATAIDTVVFQNGLNTASKKLDAPIEKDAEHDIELGRKKVLTGSNTGKYYVYLKFDNELIGSAYVSVDSNNQYTASSSTVTMGKSIRFVTYGRGGADIIKEISVIEPDPEPEEPEVDPNPDAPYYDYDEIEYGDLIDANGNPLPSGEYGVQTSVFTYNQTSPTGSAILKFRWKGANAASNFQLCFDKITNEKMDYMFGFQYYVPDSEYPNGRIWLRPGYGPSIALEAPFVTGNNYDIEFARLKVKNGDHAGEYYVYLKINGEMFAKDYVAADVVDSNGNYVSNPGSATCSISNEIFLTFWGGGGGNKICATPFVEEYETYDEIGYDDLIDANGNPLPAGEFGVQTSVFTYNKTSPTNSAILKYCWKGANAASNFQLCFDKISNEKMAYMFGLQYYVPDAEYANGRIWLRPGYGPSVALENAFVTGKNYNIEFARLKVKNGPNAGKYYIYLKINDVLFAEDYVAADVVDANGNYVSNPGSTTCTISNEIFISFWGGGGGNKIAPYKEKQEAIEQEGTSGDFNGDGEINATDLTTLRKILLGTQDTTEMPEGIDDFNNDGEVNIIDLVAMKKYLAPANTYVKQGGLTLGMQEHLGEDETKTAEYIADASATLGASAYRLSMPIHQLYYANSANEAVVREDNMATFKGMVAALKAQGITEILYVTDSFILPYGYADNTKNHNITVPDPEDDVENYVAWLTINADAFKALAEEVPEIKFFEPFNEINTTGTRLERYGCAWNASSDMQAAYKFTIQEKAAIMADLCWYVSAAVKSVDSANQVTTPSIVVGSNVVIENDFIEEFYTAIESGNYPTNKTLGDKRVDNYFTIVNIHAYPDYTEDDSLFGDNFESNANAEISEWAGRLNTTYDVVKAHNDGASRVWITETGMSTYYSNGEPRDEDNVARLIELALEKLDVDLTFVDTVIFYKIADISSNNGASPSETYFGLFRSGDDLDDPYVAKPSAEVIYSFFHNGSTDYAALDALVSRYDG